jgi:putative (di)nucleoside polyphosphate hydrolase
MKMPSKKSLPYRPCAGMCVINRDGLVFIGRRTTGPELMDAKRPWQMPQGGIDDGEDPYKAALRELYEETNIRSVEKAGEIAEWLTYDLPDELIGKAWRGKYRGQTMKWYAFRFTGAEGEIDIVHPGGGHHKPEFVAWRWTEMSALPELAIPFKLPTYKRVAEEFASLAKKPT